MERSIPLSVVIPVYNEADNIKDLFHEILEVCERGMDGVPFDYEIIIVDDGSSDRTEEVCRTLAPLTYIRFRRNYGQTAAMDCGFKHAAKEFVAALDGDGQNDPSDIPDMIRYLLVNDLDVVSGWRRDRQDPPGKRAASRAANQLRHRVIHDGINDSGCTLKIYRRSCLQGLDLYGEQHRFIPALLKIRGASIGEMEVHHRRRRSGKSKYGISRIFKGTLDLLSVWFWNKFASRPLYLFGSMGALTMLLGLVFFIGTVADKISDGGLNSVVLLLSFTCFLIGVVLFSLGLISDMIIHVYYQGSRTHYQIGEIRVFENMERKPVSAAGGSPSCQTESQDEKDSVE
ncbi:MAG: glycosyltransferase family 2 protein [Eubacteriales bacterium]|nr:glycosyltransferase family 2 protein [Eubacteriales bacterium]